MKKVLVIEDSTALLNDIVEMLTLEGFETYQATNGQEGVEMALQHLPDLIVCDIRMPIMDGYGVLDLVRSNPMTANIPFIFLTARTGRSEIREGMQLGADDYLTKPFTAEELISSIHSRLARQSKAELEAERKLDRLRKSIALALPHELRTPLNAILGFSEILTTDALSLSTDQVTDMAQHINNAAMRLYHLIENYVIYANLEILGSDDKRGKVLRQGRTNYATVIISQQAEEQARKYNRENDLNLDIPEDNRILAINGENLSRIVQELVDNAFKFSKPGKKVAVEVKTTDSHLELRVMDEGWGMSTEEIASIGAYMQFERAFFEQQGIGFGLTIAKRMTELHLGEFMIESVQGQYTHIKITLPFAVEEEPQIEA